VVWILAVVLAIWRHWRSLLQCADSLSRRLIAVSAVVGLGLTVALVARGLPPPPSLAIGALAMLGALLAIAGLAGVERALLETSFETRWRLLTGERLPSTAASRAVAIALGALILGGVATLARWAW